MCDKLSPEGDSPDRWSRLTDKLESAEATLAAATKRAESAEQENARLREALEWIVRPGIPFYSHAEFERRVREVASAALLAKPEEKQ